MSVNVDTKKMREALAEFSSETVVISHDELVNLLDRVDRGEKLRTDLDAWLADCPATRRRA